MKRLIALFLMIFVLCGCSNSAEPVPAAEPAKAALWTEEQLLEAFRQNAREGAQLFDCVVMEQTACEIAGVVQYTLGEDHVCRFDFIKTDGSVCRMGMEFMIDGEKTLAFAGTDSVSCRMLREDGSAYVGTIIYYEDAGTGENGFRVSEENVPQPEEPQPEETFFQEESVDPHDPSWTEQELLTAFYQYAEVGTEVIGCVVQESSACDIVGVVQYTREEEEGCWFDFLNSQGFPHSTGVKEGTTISDTLVFAGVDMVQCRMQDADGTQYICEVTYFEEPDGITTGFKLVSR